MAANPQASLKAIEPFRAAAADLVVAVTPTISTQPSGEFACLDSGVTFTVVADSAVTMSYQWQLDGVDISAATSSSLTISNVVEADAGLYSVVVTDLERDPQRVFGGTLEPRLELHCVPAPSAAERARWQRGLTIGSPRASGSTTKDGSSSVSQPIPYETHEPITGNPLRRKPVFSSKVAGV